MAVSVTKAGTHSRLLKIGEVARLAGIGIEALRFYERQGLLTPSSRTASGYRLYGVEALEQLDFVRRSQALGFSLSEIAAIVEESRSGRKPCSTVRDLVRQRIRELDERLAELKRYRRELAKTLEGWETLGDVKGHVCGLIESTDAHSPRPQSRKFGRKNNVD
jgi:DNA-binding transcriptional MerR regulator